MAFSSCKHNTATAPESESIVVIFDNYHPKPYKTPGGGSNINNYGFFYVDTLNRMVSHFAKGIKDTLVLKPVSDFMEAGVSYRNFEEVYFYLHKGDTVILSLDSLDYPTVKSKNNPAYTRIYNLNASLRKGKTHHNLEPYVWLGDQTFLTIVENIDELRSMKSNLANDFCPVDTLKKMFVDYEHEYKSTYKNYFSDKKITAQEYERALYWLKLKKIIAEREIGGDKEKFYQNLKDGLSDTLIAFPSYHRYLYHYFTAFVNHNNVWIKQKTGSHADYRLCFDNILEDRSIPPLSKNILLKYCMEGVSEFFSGKDIQIYLTKYLNYTGDSLFFNKLANKYNLAAEATELQLKSLSNTYSTLDELLQRHRGKLLYIDFWASWCAPCRTELPYSDRLQEKYAGKEIVFVYLAYNDTEDNWRKACQESGLKDKNAENYLITNFKTSSFIADLSINTIPRYLLYGKDGKLINENAPRPSSENIISLIDSNL